jgi:hypothetical protein
MTDQIGKRPDRNRPFLSAPSHFVPSALFVLLTSLGKNVFKTLFPASPNRTPLSLIDNVNLLLQPSPRLPRGLNKRPDLDVLPQPKQLVVPCAKLHPDPGFRREGGFGFGQVDGLVVVVGIGG